jgi:SAM-dependent methyltransferase
LDPAYLAAHVEEDARHWYFRGRLAVIHGALRRVLPRRRLRLVDIGCGTGAVLRKLADFGEAVGIEASEVLLATARAAGLDARKGALPDDLPIAAGWADVVLLLDVIEHLDDDAAALRAAGRLLTAHGVLVVTVPAYPWLWSGHDLVLGHRRRYVAGPLRRLIEGAGYRVERLTYFNTVLFPAIAGRRLYKRLRGDESHDLRRPGRALNGLLERLFALERHVVPTPTLPFGTSLLVVARRS